MVYVIALVPDEESVSRLLDKNEYDELVVSEYGEGFGVALARALEVDDPIITMVSLGALGESTLEIFSRLDTLRREHRKVSLRFKHLDYRVVRLGDAPRNTVSGASLDLLCEAVAVCLGVETMVQLDSDRRVKVAATDHERIRELQEQGYTQAKMAKELGVSRATVARHWAKIKLEGF